MEFGRNRSGGVLSGRSSHGNRTGMATTTNNDLAQNLEQLIADFVQASQKMVLAAVAQTLTSSLAAPATAPSPSKPSKRAKPSERAKPSKRAKPSEFRTSAQLAALGERFYEALCAHPGQTMAVLAHKAGSSPDELRYPVVRLIRAGRVRRVGQRQTMRYFPSATAVEAA